MQMVVLKFIACQRSRTIFCVSRSDSLGKATGMTVKDVLNPHREGAIVDMLTVQVI